MASVGSLGKVEAKAVGPAAGVVPLVRATGTRVGLSADLDYHVIVRNAAVDVVPVADSSGRPVQAQSLGEAGVFGQVGHGFCLARRYDRVNKCWRRVSSQFFGTYCPVHDFGNP